MKKGKKIFLAQLDKMTESGQITLERPPLKLRLPIRLKDAFNAFHLEFLTLHGMSAHKEGGFFDDEDTCQGIKAKLNAVFGPIADMLQAEYNIKISVRIEASYEDSSCVLFIASGFAKLTDSVGVVIMQDHIKAWSMYFGSIEDVYKYNERIYKEAKRGLEIAFSVCNKTE